MIDIVRGLGLVALCVLLVALLGIFGFVLMCGLIIVTFCGIPLSVTRGGKRIGTIRWGRYRRDEE